MLNLDGKVAVVTGASSGIGLTTTKAFVAKGVKAVLSDINEESGIAHTEALRADGHAVAFFKANVAHEDEVKSLVQFAVETFSKLALQFEKM
ncbi:SDR family NAD(P)-dependent oxidoreductase [Lysinibacillus sp. NPDC056959]|uniref:SDR family NAD(P)-dependent oxidoreductase n=1 Tax=Lysinibacillus sp. NPDC056959 TaxID=3345981 RepID=UPI0036281157